MLLLTLNVIFVLIAIAMVALILMQRGAGAQAGSGFGAGASATVFGSRAPRLCRRRPVARDLFFAILCSGWNATQARAPSRRHRIRRDGAGAAAPAVTGRPVRPPAAQTPSTGPSAPARVPRGANRSGSGAGANGASAATPTACARAADTSAWRLIIYNPTPRA